jgi:hypothetical protein
MKSKRIHLVVEDWRYKCMEKMSNELGISISEVLRTGIDFMRYSKESGKLYNKLLHGDGDAIDELHHETREACRRHSS